MIKVECHSGYKINERPVKFTLMERSYLVKEIIDTWYGEKSVYFKVKADDENIYLLKYDEWQDQWDLVFYQNPRKLKILMPSSANDDSSFQPVHEQNNRQSPTLLN